MKKKPESFDEKDRVKIKETGQTGTVSLVNGRFIRVELDNGGGNIKTQVFDVEHLSYQSNLTSPDYYKYEIEKLFPIPKQDGTPERQLTMTKYGFYRDGAIKFATEIHSIIVKKKDERIAELEMGLRETSKREMEVREYNFELEGKLSTRIKELEYALNNLLECQDKENFVTEDEYILEQDKAIEMGRKALETKITQE